MHGVVVVVVAAAALVVVVTVVVTAVVVLIVTRSRPVGLVSRRLINDLGQLMQINIKLCI